MGEGGGGEEKVSLLQLSPFFASVFPLFPQKRLILRLTFMRVFEVLVKVGIIKPERLGAPGRWEIAGRREGGFGKEEKAFYLLPFALFSPFPLRPPAPLLLRCCSDMDIPCNLNADPNR